jgi:hypothetical protein
MTKKLYCFNKNLVIALVQISLVAPVAYDALQYSTPRQRGHLDTRDFFSLPSRIRVTSDEGSQAGKNMGSTRRSWTRVAFGHNPRAQSDRVPFHHRPIDDRAASMRQSAARSQVSMAVTGRRRGAVFFFTPPTADRDAPPRAASAACTYAADASTQRIGPSLQSFSLLSAD